MVAPESDSRINVIEGRKRDIEYMRTIETVSGVVLELMRTPHASSASIVWYGCVTGHYFLSERLTQGVHSCRLSEATRNGD